jgi:hypothetical protein
LKQVVPSSRVTSCHSEPDRRRAPHRTQLDNGPRSLPDEPEGRQRTH